MKNRNVIRRNPTAEELYAVERAARRERSIAIGNAFRSTAAAVARVVARALSAPATKEVRHA